MRTVEHPRRPVRLVAGSLKPWPDARDANCVVWFPVPGSDEAGAAAGSLDAEGIPAVRLDGDRARLVGIPLFPYHLGLGDEVSIIERDAALYGEDVVIAAQLLTVRIFHSAGHVSMEQALSDPESDEPFWRIARALAPHGVWFERYSTEYAALAIDVAEWEYVRAFLDLHTRTSGVQWELATPLRVDADGAPQ